MKTKTTLLLTICCLLNTFLSFSQSLNWQWATASKGPSYQEGYSIAADKNNNVYLGGWFGGDSITFDSTTLFNGGASNSHSNSFITKYSPSGQVLWAASPINTAFVSVAGLSIATDENGSAYVTGQFGGDSVTFGNIILHVSISNFAEMFITKYDSSGNALWAKGASGYTTAGYGVATDKSGNAYVTGYFGDNICSFGGITVVNSSITSADVFIVKYDGSGNVLWARCGKSPGDSRGRAIATDKNNNVYVTGLFSGDSITFGSKTLYLSSPNSIDIFIAKYDSAGNALWAKSAGYNYENDGFAIATDGNDNVYITGRFSGDSITFGPYTFYNATPQLYDMFIAKYDTKGNVLWARSAGGNLDDIGYSVATDTNYNVYVTGGFASDSIPFGSNILQFSAGASDPMFIVTYDSVGNVLCATALASGGDDWSAVCVDQTGNAYLGGDFFANLFIVGADSLNLTGQENIFVAKFKCGINIATDVVNVNESESLQIYPNPFSNHANVKYSIPPGSKNATLIIYDLLGRQRNTYKLSNAEGQIEINAGNLSSGIYFCSLVVDGKNVEARKMVTQE